MFHYMRIIYLFVLFRAPLILVTVLLLSVNPDFIAVEKRNPNFQYGEVQAAIAVFLLVLCFIGKYSRL